MRLAAGGSFISGRAARRKTSVSPICGMLKRPSGQKIPGMDDAMAKRVELALRAALLSQLNGSPE